MRFFYKIFQLRTQLMTRQGHIKIGIISSLATLVMTHEPFLFLGILLGSTAPDALEISYRDEKGYKGYSRLIPHRTITHWFPVWLVIGVAIQYLPLILPAENFFYSFFARDEVIKIVVDYVGGFSVGCLLHILTDFFSPMGVPIFTPRAKSRKRLVFYKTGQTEIFFILGFLILALLVVTAFFANKNIALIF